MKIIIAGMVCAHCVAAAAHALASTGLSVNSVSLGSADIDADTLTPAQTEAVSRALDTEGFQLIDDPDSTLVDAAKRAVIAHVRNADECRLNLSACIERQVGTDYDTVSRVFSRHEGRTIEKYAIAQRIELVKELLGYHNLTLAEIAFRAGYSSTAHLSRQFKAVTGMTPTAYAAGRPSRRPLNLV